MGTSYVRRLVARMLWNGMSVDQIIHSTGVSIAEMDTVVEEMNSLCSDPIFPLTRSQVH